MKKYVFFLLLTTILFSLTGCQNECYYHSKSIYLDVAQSEWKFDKDQQQFYAHFNLNQITSDIFNYGNYTLHREYNTNTKDVYQVGLPQSLYLWENVTEADGSEVTVYYQQLVDYRVGVGYVEIQVTNSDYFYPEDASGNKINPEAMVFHLQLIY